MTLKISCNWLERAAKPTKDELEATLAALRVLINDKNVTSYVTIIEGARALAGEIAQDKLQIPAYFLAEWIAENWWPLHYEPRKTEGSDDVAFHSRHSLLRAQHGFALPDIQFEPLGEALRISCRGREAPIPGVRFRESATTVVDRVAVQAVLRTFLQSCVDRLESCAVADTPFQQALADIQQTSPEQAIFCSLVGALGINPYGASAELAAAIDKIYDGIGERASMDLCMASTEDEVISLGDRAIAVSLELDGPHDSTLAPLANFRLPADNKSLPSWRRGKNTAINVRKLLNIRADDHLGSDKFLDALKISTDAGTPIGTEDIIFTGAVDRIEHDAKFVLLQSREEARRFAASRAVFLAISSELESRRLVTDAMTRDQQASRAFAAEMLVPIDYLRAQAKGGKIARDGVLEIARKWRASVDVVKYQATNNGLITNTTF